jgi:hypothetical protein
MNGQFPQPLSFKFSTATAANVREQFQRLLPVALHADLLLASGFRNKSALAVIFRLLPVRHHNNPSVLIPLNPPSTFQPAFSFNVQIRNLSTYFFLHHSDSFKNTSAIHPSTFPLSSTPTQNSELKTQNYRSRKPELFPPKLLSITISNHLRTPPFIHQRYPYHQSQLQTSNFKLQTIPYFSCRTGDLFIHSS